MIVFELKNKSLFIVKQGSQKMSAIPERPLGIMDRNEIQEYFQLEEPEMKVIDDCINGYGQSNPIGQLFYRAVEWLQSLFGKSDWQQAMKILKVRERTKLFEAAPEAGITDMNDRAQTMLRKCAKVPAQMILDHQIALKCNFSWFSPISFNQWSNSDFGRLHPKDMLNICLKVIKRELDRDRGLGNPSSTTNPT
jgi:hypothetical protein